MPTADYSTFHQPSGTAADGTKYDNFIDAVQTTVNALDKNNLAAAAGILPGQLADPTTGKVLGSSGGACAAVFPPGTKLAYVEQTSNQASVATTAATATSVVSSGAVTFDGTEVLIEFYTPGAQHSVIDSAAVFELYDSATDLGEMGQTFSPVANGADALTLRRYMTPSAGSHTYSVRMWSPTAGTTTALAGLGGAGVLLPLYIRITKA